MRSFAHELFIAARSLARRPGFTAVAIFTLALGIGAVTALFTLVDSVLVRPLPYEDPDRLVALWENRKEQETRDITVSLANYEDWHRFTESFQAMAAVMLRPYNLNGRGDPLRAPGLEITASLLPLLGYEPALGRGFTREDARLGAEPVCMIGHGLWLSRFGGTSSALLQRVLLDDRAHTVVGVLPPAFEVPGLGSPAVVTPLVADSTHPNYRGNHNAMVLARLEDGVSTAEANRELAALALRLELQQPQWNDGIGAHLRPLKEQLVRSVRTYLVVLFAATGFVLLIVCTNLATLMLARAGVRTREMAVRAAMGADGWHLARQWVIEALLLALAGGLGGLAVAAVGIESLKLWGGASLPRLNHVSLDGRVVLFAVGTSLASAVVFSFLPALASGRVQISTALKLSSPTGKTQPRQQLRRLLVAVQVTIALVLLVGSGLLLKSLGQLLDVDPGFRTDRRIAMSVSLPQARYEEREQVARFFHELVAKVEAIPAVHSAAATLGLPFEGSFWRKHLTIEERPAVLLSEVPVVDYTVVTPGYLETMEVPLLVGRALLPRDDGRAPFVAVVNQTFVRAHYPAESPIGRRIRLSAPDHLLPEELRGYFPWYTIVGVVGDVRRRGLGTAAQPEVFITLRQNADTARSLFVVAHTDPEPSEALAAELQRQVWELDADQPIAWVRSLDDLQAETISLARMSLLLISAFALTALLLAAVGLYGLLVHSVVDRTFEIGVRMALGASRERILATIVAQGVGIAALGIAVGLPLALALTRLLQNLLFGVAATDGATFAAVVILLVAVTLLATLAPAWRASRLAPTEALRCE